MCKFVYSTNECSHISNIRYMINVQNWLILYNSINVEMLIGIQNRHFTNIRTHPWIFTQKHFAVENQTPIQLHTIVNCDSFIDVAVAELE